MRDPDFFRVMEREARWRRRWIRRLAMTPRPIAFGAGWGVAFIHPDTYPGRRGMWRVTWLQDGEPTGHADADDFVSALNRAKDEGANLFDVVPVSAARLLREAA